MKITILTLFPQMFEGPFRESIIRRAIDKKLLEFEFVDIRNFGIGAHKTVDDTPYGGGVGMLMKVDVVKAAIDSVKTGKKDEAVVLMSASGNKYTQEKAKKYSKLSHLILICGHYEGVDYRIKKYVDEEISIGDYVLTGGEIPAMVVADSVARLTRGVLSKEATVLESFSDENILEYPQYTKPQNFDGEEVPKILLSGNHKEIEEWRKKEALRETQAKRSSSTKKQRQQR